MIRLLKRKIKSQSGMSMVYALFALVICVMISAVIINTASTHAGSARKAKDDNQKYLSVESAARMLGKMIMDDSITYEVSERSYSYRAASSVDPFGLKKEDSESHINEDSFVYKGGSDIISTGIREWAENIIREKAASAGKTFVISKPNEAMDDVTIILSMEDGEDDKYSIFAEIFIQEGDRKANVLNLTASGYHTEIGVEYTEGDYNTDAMNDGWEVREDTITYTYRVNWDNVLIKKAGEED